jgi:hypothetical protein
VVLVALGASAAMMLWMMRPLFRGEIPFTGDLLHLHYPLREFYANALASGQRFDWMPSLLGGFYVVGEGQVGGYHPFHWLLYRFVALDHAFMLELVAAYPFMFAGTFLFLRRWCGRGPAVIGALLFTFSGFTLGHGVHPNMVTIVAHVPWQLWTIHRTLTAGDVRARLSGAGVLALLTGSQLLLGHPQSVWFSGLIELAYAGMVLAMVPKGARAAGCAAFAGGKLLGVGVGAVQLLATFYAAARSVRAASDVSFATTFSLPPLHLFQLLHPYVFWGRVLRWNEAPGAGDEFAAYGGAVALTLATWWLASSFTMRGRQPATPGDRLATWAAVCGAFGLWMALGRYGGIYYLQTRLPIVGLFRGPVRYVFFAHFALAIMAAVAWSRLARTPASPGRSSRALLAPWALVIVAALSAWGLARRDADAASSASLAAVAFGPIVFALAAAVLTAATRGARWALVALALLAAGDQALYGLGGVVGWRDYIERSAVPGFLDTRDVPAGTGRLMHGGFPNLYTLAGYQALDGYLGLTPAKVLDYHSPAALRIAGVRYIHSEFQEVARVPDAEPLARGWFRVAPPVARARLVAQARASRRPAVDLETIDVAREALTTHDLGLKGGPAGRARVVRDAPGDIRLTTTAESRQLVVVTESFDDGWTVRIDGEPAAVERVNGDFLGCVVPSGSHTVAFAFRPRHLAVGQAIGVAAFAMAMILLVTGRQRGRLRP